MNIKLILEHYVLKMWKKLSRSDIICNVIVNDVVEDIQPSATQQYKDICPLLIMMVNEACKSP